LRVNGSTKFEKVPVMPRPLVLVLRSRLEEHAGLAAFVLVGVILQTHPARRQR
jgi:hypothetical protein